MEILAYLINKALGVKTQKEPIWLGNAWRMDVGGTQKTYSKTCMHEGLPVRSRITKPHIFYDLVDPEPKVIDLHTLEKHYWKINGQKAAYGPMNHATVFELDYPPLTTRFVIGMGIQGPFAYKQVHGKSSQKNMSLGEIKRVLGILSGENLLPTLSVDGTDFLRDLRCYTACLEDRALREPL